MILSQKRFKSVFLFQLVITFFVEIGITFISTALDDAWRYYQPIRALIIILVTIIICLLVGLPTRFNTKINNWWVHHQPVSIAGIMSGLILLFLSSLKNLQEVESYGDIVMVKTNPFLSITGWFLTAFCLLHLYPSVVFRIWVIRVCPFWVKKGANSKQL
jgi:hypothetical protein